MKNKLFVTVIGLCAFGMLVGLSGTAWANADDPDVTPFGCTGLTHVTVENPSGTAVKGTLSFVMPQPAALVGDIDFTLSLSLKPQGKSKDVTETIFRGHMVQAFISTRLEVGCQVMEFAADGSNLNLNGPVGGILNLIKDKTRIILTHESITGEGDQVQNIPGSDPPLASAIADVRIYLD